MNNKGRLNIVFEIFIEKYLETETKYLELFYNELKILSIK